MTSINLLPEDLRKREKLHQDKKPEQKEVVFVRQQKEEIRQKPQQGQGHRFGLIKDILARLKSRFKKGEAQQKKTALKKQPSVTAQQPQPKELPAQESKKIDTKSLLMHKKPQVDEKREEVDVNLLKEEITLLRSIKPEVVKLLIVSGVLLIVSYGAGFFYQIRQGSLRDKITELEGTLQTLGEQQASLIEKQNEFKDKMTLFETVDLLISKRIDWVAFLEALEERTLKTVYFTGLKAGQLEGVSVSAKAKTIEDALYQIQILERSPDFISMVSLKQLSPKEEVVTVQEGDEERVYVHSFVDFSFEFSVNPEWIQKNSLGL